MENAALAACVRGHVPGLRAAVLFGSCLSPVTRRSSSIPDVLAVVDDLDPALAAFGLSPFRRWLARPLAPVTVALRASGPAGAGGPVVAKLTLVTPVAARAALGRLRDLSLAGRLAKKTRLLFHRDAGAGAELARLLDQAADAMVRATMLGLPRCISLAEATRRCFALSYRAEPRPESPEQIDARYRVFAADHRARYQPRFIATARASGVDVCHGALIDRRPAPIRRRHRRALGRLLVRARLRAVLRWSRQLLLYRGWFPYLIGKLRRSWT